MSLDRSLKTAGSLSRHRNVLKRGERINALKEKDAFKEDDTSPFGLPKVAHRKVPVGGKTKKKKVEEGEAGAVAAPAAAPAKK